MILVKNMIFRHFPIVFYRKYSKIKRTVIPPCCTWFQWLIFCTEPSLNILEAWWKGLKGNLSFTLNSFSANDSRVCATDRGYQLHQRKPSLQPHASPSLGLSLTHQICPCVFPRTKNRSYWTYWMNGRTDGSVQKQSCLASRGNCRWYAGLSNQDASSSDDCMT